MTTANVRSETILQRCVVLTLECHYLGNHRSVKPAKFVQDAIADDADEQGSSSHELKVDTAQFSVTKKLVDQAELKPCMSIIANAKSFLRKKAIPTPTVFGDRSYLIPLAAVQAVNEQLTSLSIELAVEGAKLADRYAAAIAKQSTLLGKQFDPSQYPAADQVRSAFRIDWDYVQFSAPERLETVSSAMYAHAQAKHDARMAEAYDEVRLVLRDSLRRLTAEIASKLEPDLDGSPKVFRNSILSGLGEFLENFDIRNVTDDDELSAVVAQLKQLTNGVDAKSLRDMDSLRESIATEMAEATARLDGMVKKVRRAITFGDL